MKVACSLRNQVKDKTLTEITPSQTITKSSGGKKKQKAKPSRRAKLFVLIFFFSYKNISGNSKRSIKPGTYDGGCGHFKDILQISKKAVLEEWSAESPAVALAAKHTAQDAWPCTRSCPPSHPTGELFIHFRLRTLKTYPSVSQRHHREPDTLVTSVH